MKHTHTDNKAMAAIRYVTTNRNAADAVKTALHMAPGSTAKEIHEALSRTHDITQQHTKFLLYGMKLNGTIKAIGISEYNTKKWALADSEAEEVSIDIQIDTAILQLCRDDAPWMSAVIRNVIEATAGATEKDVFRSLKLLVRARRLEPFQARWRPGELYPDIRLMNPTKKVALTKVGLGTLAIKQKLDELKNQGVRQIAFKDLAGHFEMTKIGLRKHLEKLHQAGSIHFSRPGSGRTRSSTVTLDLSLLGYDDIQRTREMLEQAKIAKEKRELANGKTEEEPKPPEGNADGGGVVRGPSGSDQDNQASIGEGNETE